jgi:hypothetical protein
MIFGLKPACTTRLATNMAHPTAIVTPQKICKYLKPPLSTVTSAPPIGEPVKAATEITAKRLPFLTPISRMSEIWAMRDGARETKAPEEKPKRAAKMMIGTLPLEGSQRASTMTALKVLTTIMVLKRPKRSATMPGRMRPNMLVGVSVEIFGDNLDSNDFNDLPHSIEDGDQIIGKIHGHAIRLRLKNDIGEG